MTVNIMSPFKTYTALLGLFMILCSQSAVSQAGTSEATKPAAGEAPEEIHAPATGSMTKPSPSGDEKQEGDGAGSRSGSSGNTDTKGNSNGQPLVAPGKVAPATKSGNGASDSGSN
jgi:hypothetical protein